MTTPSGTTVPADHHPAPGHEQLPLIPGPTLRSDVAWHHSRRCDCQKTEGAAPCGSCPFTLAWPGMTRTSAQR
jgi:hypothetical protein